MKKLTIQWFKDNKACNEGFKWVKETFKDKKEIPTDELIQILIDEDRYNWANWTICRVLSKEQKVKYAIFCAEQVLDIFEKKYPDDKRPRIAIEAAKKYLENPIEENRRAAADAAYASYTAADAASYAAAKKEIWLRILNYGLSLLKMEE